MSALPHVLRLGYRGDCHIHRWAATCDCGWIGVYRRRRRDAEKLYRQHVASSERKLRLRRRLVRSAPPGRRTPTRPELLPEALRRSG